MSLTDFQCKSAKPVAEVVKFSDGGGLQLWMTPDGAKHWPLGARNGLFAPERDRLFVAGPAHAGRSAEIRAYRPK